MRQSLKFNILISCSLFLILLLQACTVLQEKEPPKYLVMLELTSSDCADCQEIHRIIQNLKPIYKDRITFITLDISNSTNRLNARETAKRFNGEIFVKRNQNSPGTVILFNALYGQKIFMLQNIKEEAKYIEMFENGLKSDKEPK